LKKKAFAVLGKRRQLKSDLKALFLVQKQRSEALVKQRLIARLVNHFIIEPKLDRIGELHFLRK